MKQIASRQPLQAPGVVIDDESEALSRREDVEDNDFSETSRELSVVNERPITARAQPRQELGQGPFWWSTTKRDP